MTVYHKKLLFWGFIYLLIIAGSLAGAAVGHDEPDRGFWVEFGAGLGFAGWAMLCLQFLLTARFRSIAAPFGFDELLNFHRQAGYIASLFVLAHAVILMAADPEFRTYLLPEENLPRAAALNLVIVLILLLTSLTLWRKQFGLVYEWWRVSHGAFAFLIVMIGLAHILMVGFYIDSLWQQFLWVLVTGFAVTLLLYARVFKPLVLRRYPYSVARVTSERNDVHTLVLEADGHDGFPFQAGQFIWITLGPSPFRLQQHPFTIASGEHQTGRYEITIRELGDFTSTVANTVPGTRAWIEGPYGTFTLKDPAPPMTVLIAGGIGITPMMSFLRSAAKRGDPRHFILFYANPDFQSAIFSDELSQLEERLHLTVIHILESPPDNWGGETGLADRDILDRHLPDSRTEGHYYLCGPEPMMDSLEPELLRMGVPVSHIHSERFNIV